jgi:ATP-dependent DNA ligase
LKERRLAKFLVKVLGLEASGRAKVLADWRTDERFGRSQGDLSAIVFDLVQRSEHAAAPTLIIFEVNALLDTLASDANESTLNKLFRCMTSLECKWITRIILKQLALNIEPKFYFYAFHGWYIFEVKLVCFLILLRMWKVYEMKSDLEKACNAIVQIIADGYTSDRLEKGDSFARIASKYFQPELGTCISVMQCDRGKGIPQIAAKLKDKTAYVEVKYDGERVQAHFNADWAEKLVIFSKSGRNSTINRIGIKPYLLHSLQNVKTGIFEGELLVYNEIRDSIEAFGTVQDLGRSELKEYTAEVGDDFVLCMFLVKM